MNKKSWVSNNPIKSILLGLIISIIFFVLLLYLVFGNPVQAFIKMFELRGEPNKTGTAMSSLSYIVTWILTIYSICVTGIFSFLVWKINKRSLKISEELKNIEGNREFEYKREKAIIVYYDLQRGFTIIRDLYIKHILKKDFVTLDRAFFSQNWIENVASLRKDLSNDEINNIYYIYNALFTIQSYLDNETSNEKFEKYLGKIVRQFFLDFIPSPLMGELRECGIEELVSIDNYLLMHKLYKLTFNKDEVNIGDNDIQISNGNYYKKLSGDFYNGEGVIYNSYGKVKMRGFFYNGFFASGTYYGYNGLDNQYEIVYESISNESRIKKGVLYNNVIDPKDENLINAKYLDGVPYEGKIIKFNNNYISYWGNVVNGKKDGKGKTFSTNGSIYYDGVYNNDEKINGKLYSSDGTLSFDGEFKDGRPWNGRVRNMDFYYIKRFNGTILEGKAYEGKGLILKITSRGESLNDLRYQEEMEVEYNEIQGEYFSSEEYEEEQSSWHNENQRNSYMEWEDYIYADWKEGVHIEREDKESNKKVYYYPQSEIK
ncbi:hypothetical protein [Lysinibacillus sp. NPDC093692]|uniref:hypothetical protein n=1 Tax=Lysinibacillus sp. NPDC093692 TaxID=3390578 RepID=UPI003CFDBE65